MERILDRLEHVLRAKGWGVTQWESKAGMGQGQLATVMKRLREKPSAGMSLETVRRLADAAEVSRAWLAWEDGDPDAVVRMISHQRRQAMKLAEGVASERVLSAVELEPDTEPPRTVGDWSAVIEQLVRAERALHARIRSGTGVEADAASQDASVTPIPPSSMRETVEGKRRKRG